MRDLSDVDLRPSEFEEFRRLCAKDRDFPPDLAAWHVMMERAALDARTRGLFPEPLLLDVSDFREWCGRMNVMACLDSLRAFVILRRRENASEAGSPPPTS